MEHITVEKIIEIHDKVIFTYDGASGILAESTLHYLVFRLTRNRDVFRKAALALHAIGTQHPFIDGNKRTALVVAENILGLEGWYIAAGDDQIVEFMIGVASYQIGLEEIEAWLHDHAEKME